MVFPEMVHAVATVENMPIPSSVALALPPVPAEERKIKDGISRYR